MIILAGMKQLILFFLLLVQFGFSQSLELLDKEYGYEEIKLNTKASKYPFNFKRPDKNNWYYADKAFPRINKKYSWVTVKIKNDTIKGVTVVMHSKDGPDSVLVDHIKYLKNYYGNPTKYVKREDYGEHFYWVTDSVFMVTSIFPPVLFQTIYPVKEVPPKIWSDYNEQ